MSETSSHHHSTSAADRSRVARAEMDALIDGHFRAEEAGDVAAIVAGFDDVAEHDVPGRPGGTIRGSERIAGFYRPKPDPRSARASHRPIKETP